jgi:hypothetical protein
VTEISEGTNEIQKYIIAREIFGREWSILNYDVISIFSNTIDGGEV